MGIIIQNSNGSFTSIDRSLLETHFDFDKKERKEFDERKSVDANDIQIININCCSADITLKPNYDKDCSSIDVHFFGEAIINGSIEFSVYKLFNELQVTITSNASFINSKLKLEINVPSKGFKTINVESKNGSVIICPDVVMQDLKVRTQNGSLYSCGVFNNVYANVMNGNIEISINNKSDLNFDVHTMNGSSIIFLYRIGTCKIQVSSMNGKAKNNFIDSSDYPYTARGQVTSMNGSVTIV